MQLRDATKAAVELLQSRAWGLVRPDDGDMPLDIDPQSSARILP
ncbi:MAG TPA: hypothetical protein PLJ27_16160 [Polyangiaceae bacterium]|jgi:hypothetical protein|nr:hypothetical protein [Polyangiaceae bacterium]HNZ23013.1 hypothetical protein [Polyangiaceae bacterium]HOD21210.1 hypothetical protein [Polyangiaceae bacterium]HOE49026.1 hypothetical protein [Polyangiaceae bacterium]HOH01847.1 hypothetical protein [Polyangiaceae bacterium]